MQAYIKPENLHIGNYEIKQSQHQLFKTKFQGHRRVHLDFYKLILFYLVLSELLDMFNSL